MHEHTENVMWSAEDVHVRGCCGRKRSKGKGEAGKRVRIDGREILNTTNSFPSESHLFSFCESDFFFSELHFPT